MQINPQNIEKHGFKLLEKVEYKNYKTFTKNLNWKNSRSNYIYNISIGLSLTLTIFLIFKSSEIHLFETLFALLGVLLAFVFVIVHEAIHYLMYMVFGAKKIKVISYLTKGYLLTVADHFLIGKKEVLWIAIMPYLIITLSCIASILFLNDLMQIMLSSTILLHTSMCKEDFRIIHFFYSQNSEMKMYTDIETETTFFYRKLDSSQ